MKYFDTRGKCKEGIPSAEAIKRGLAYGGGLYMPENIPSLSLEDIMKIKDMSYPERAAYILSLFLDDYGYDRLLSYAKAAYSPERFPEGAAPVVKLNDEINVLELFHGPTCAFKDMALQIMPRLLSGALEITGEKNRVYILVATSGDTGKAALEGYRDIPGISIKVYYPVNGVSKIQRAQMVTQEGDNVSVCAVEGNFDDAQTGVKRIFSSSEAKEKLAKRGIILSSANSINWGRLAPQIAYYFSAYADLIASGEIQAGDEVNVCVPTGNFGNIFAGYIAKRMGLPVSLFITASNSNNILTDFLRTGTYDRNREFYTTISPSMDILISSNLERLLYLTAGSEKTADYMEKLSSEGSYTVDEETKENLKDFAGYFLDEKETRETIKSVFEKYGYLADPHTAVALGCAMKYEEETGDRKKIICDSTASPYKFAVDVYKAITDKDVDDAFDALDNLKALSGVPIPAPLANLRDKKERFTGVVAPENMLRELYAELGIE